jgi:hypothetical protein
MNLHLPSISLSATVNKLAIIDVWWIFSIRGELFDQHSPDQDIDQEKSKFNLSQMQ